MILLGFLFAMPAPRNTKTAWTKKKQTLIVLAFIYIYIIYIYIYLELRQVDISIDSIVEFLSEGDRCFLKRGVKKIPNLKANWSPKFKLPKLIERDLQDQSVQGIVGCTPSNVPLWELPI